MPSVKALSLFALLAIVKVCSEATLPFRGLGDPTDVITFPELRDPVEVVEVSHDEAEDADLEVLVEQKPSAVEEVVAHEPTPAAVEIVEEHEPLTDHSLEVLVEDDAPSEVIEVVVEHEGPFFYDKEDWQGSEDDEAFAEAFFDDEEWNSSVAIIENGAMRSSDIVKWCLNTCHNFCVKYVYGREAEFMTGKRILPLETAGCDFKGCTCSCITSFPKVDKEDAHEIVQIEELIEADLSDRLAKRYALDEDAGHEKLSKLAPRGERGSASLLASSNKSFKHAATVAVPPSLPDEDMKPECSEEVYLSGVCGRVSSRVDGYPDASLRKCYFAKRGDRSLGPPDGRNKETGRFPDDD